ncbi:hypothetical protein AK812_SmicGene615 [Symbiodinium microadriaticum]|uniref:Uncharacterized protein n=1 Tax=Symbiodinium microadriaticum TaxID=2951 RepID=A0A1Q9F6F7_SYMMI|nr:hypothetical protein AK812_SmicGene615 [Symbiodinium microadriaticum]
MIGQFPLMPSCQPKDLAREDDGIPSFDLSTSSPDTDNTRDSSFEERSAASPEPDIAGVLADWYRYDSQSPRASMLDYNLRDDFLPKRVPKAPNALMHLRHEVRMRNFLQDVTADSGVIKKKVQRKREQAGMLDEDMQGEGWISQAKSKMMEFVRQIS